MRRGFIGTGVLFFALAPTLQAGLYYSGETYAELPSQWRGYLLDHRALRMIAAPDRQGSVASLMRQEYLDARDALEAKASSQELTADESADLGALLIRLNQADKAVEVLRPAQRQHAEHFRLAANLGTAWQMTGDLTQAEATLTEAVRLAPEEMRPAEELHLRLVQLRQRDGEGGLDLLFGITFTGEDGEANPGSIAPDQAGNLTPEKVALAQRLGLWLPADGNLLWLLGEIANAYGDIRTAANILEGCVSEFGMNDLELRQRRQVYRAAADKLPAATFGDSEGDRHVGRLTTRSTRPLVRKFDFSKLPEIREGRVHFLPWFVLAETRLDRQYRPTFPEYLKRLDGTEVEMTGFMQPLGDALEVNYFLFIEYPVGCWFCESPDVTAMVFAELPEDKTVELKQGLVKIQGQLVLNDDDPEDFLFSLDKVVIGQPD